MTENLKRWTPETARPSATTTNPPAAPAGPDAATLAVSPEFSPATQQLLAHAAALQPPERRPALVIDDDGDAAKTPRLTAVTFKLRRNPGDDWIPFANTNEIGWSDEAGDTNTPAAPGGAAPPQDAVRAGMYDALALVLHTHDPATGAARTVELETDIITFPTHTGIGSRFADEITVLASKTKRPATADIASLMTAAYNEEPDPEYARQLAAELSETNFFTTAQSIADRILGASKAPQAPDATPTSHSREPAIREIDNLMQRVKEARAAIDPEDEVDFSNDAVLDAAIDLCDAADAALSTIRRLAPEMPKTAPDGTNPLRVILNGGMVADVDIPPELHGKLTVRVEDEDVDGVDEDRIATDPDGRQYCLTIFP